MNYFVDCECGVRHPLVATQAGTSLACGCGRQVAVPLLSQLRRQAGQDAYITNAAERVAKTLSDGRVPTDGRCLVCERQTSLVNRCQAICERVWVQRNRNVLAKVIGVFALIYAPFVTALTLLMRPKVVDDKVEERGREVVVTLAYHLCDSCRER